MKPIFERIVDRPLVGKHGFTLVDLEVAFNGPTLDAMPAAGLFQSDGIHPTAAGAQAVAKVFAEADGIGD
jgi:lysophospholipase L1-like esterase